MQDAPSLRGLTVLVLEDDYLLADDARQALESAGATVLGPCSTALDAKAITRDSPPDCALLDINLGGGPSFAMAEEFMARGVPLVFMTGYDGSILPQRLTHAPCLQKPAHAHNIVAAVGMACGR